MLVECEMDDGGAVKEIQGHNRGPGYAPWHNGKMWDQLRAVSSMVLVMRLLSFMIIITVSVFVIHIYSFSSNAAITIKF